VIKITVLYPNQDGGRFDMDYYCNTHTPMLLEKLGPACKGISIMQGLSGLMPGTPAPFIVGADLLFESVEAFQSAFGPHAAEIMGDIPNYTSLQPVIQISEVKM
jgi:uncharacterized protein (TIGR02118 family)